MRVQLACRIAKLGATAIALDVCIFLCCAVGAIKLALAAFDYAPVFATRPGIVPAISCGRVVPAPVATLALCIPDQADVSASRLVIWLGSVWTYGAAITGDYAL